MALGKQARLKAGYSSVPNTEGVSNNGKGKYAPTGMSQITRVSCDGVVEYNELGQPIGGSATKSKSFIQTTILTEQVEVGDENEDVCASTGTLTKVKDGTSLTCDWDQRQCRWCWNYFRLRHDGDNVKVSMDMVANSNCFVLVPTREDMTMLSQEVDSQLLWPRHLDFPLDEKALQEFCQMQPISTQCINAFMFHLCKVMEEKGTLGSYKFVDTGSISVGISKEDQAEVLNARLLTLLQIWALTTQTLHHKDFQRHNFRVIEATVKKGYLTTL
ncbi:uncharacterized protein E5676_scaffold68G001390 [Cucumis melo var. makuwa]|uniref:Uncharacterized protein n=1 Tax=Cucumis melo var. makuwa TaxID=1194695 RepID=A0A5D3C0E5_CUCMM|nr:uncharacterized protein E6C27_scaffold230G001530 [Cucumis melo var. makuwa]TYK04815.1 uncharacterized protein E5676_scaffold68G001390 [Cucumis melo var. makuwa]